MVRFHLKKAFFDGWDHILPLLAVNLVYLIIPGLAVLVFVGGEPVNSPAGIATMLTALFFSVLYFTGMAGLAFQWSKYNRTWVKDFFEAIKARFFHALLLFVLLAIMLTILLYVPYILSLGNRLYIALGLLVFWVVFFSAMALQYYLPLAMYMKADKPFKTLKKCYIVLADNMGFSAWLFLRTLFDLAMTVFTAFLIPGFCGIILSHTDGLRLILIRYNYMETHPGLPRRDLPMKQVFEAEAAELGR